MTKSMSMHKSFSAIMANIAARAAAEESVHTFITRLLMGETAFLWKEDAKQLRKVVENAVSKYDFDIEPYVRQLEEEAAWAFRAVEKSVVLEGRRQSQPAFEFLCESEAFWRYLVLRQMSKALRAYSKYGDEERRPLSVWYEEINKQEAAHCFLEERNWVYTDILDYSWCGGSAWTIIYKDGGRYMFRDWE